MATLFPLLYPAASSPRHAYYSSVMDRGTGARREGKMEKRGTGKNVDKRGQRRVETAHCFVFWWDLVSEVPDVPRHAELERKQQREEKNPTVTSNAEEAILQGVAKATGLALTSGTPPHPPQSPPNIQYGKQLALLGLPATYTSFNTCIDQHRHTQTHTLTHAHAHTHRRLHYILSIFNES